LGDVKLVRRTREVAMASDRFEIPERRSSMVPRIIANRDEYRLENVLC